MVQLTILAVVILLTYAVYTVVVALDERLEDYED
jgi:hypothetical protein